MSKTELLNWLVRYHDEKLSPKSWGNLFDLVILDPDGWRVDNKDFDEPVNIVEFIKRSLPSTVMTLKTASAVEDKVGS